MAYFGPHLVPVKNIGHYKENQKRHVNYMEYSREITQCFQRQFRIKAQQMYLNPIVVFLQIRDYNYL